MSTEQKRAEWGELVAAVPSLDHETAEGMIRLRWLMREKHTAELPMATIKLWADVIALLEQDTLKDKLLCAIGCVALDRVLTPEQRDQLRYEMSRLFDTGGAIG